LEGGAVEAVPVDPDLLEDAPFVAEVAAASAAGNEAGDETGEGGRRRRRRGRRGRGGRGGAKNDVPSGANAPGEFDGEGEAEAAPEEAVAQAPREAARGPQPGARSDAGEGGRRRRRRGRGRGGEASGPVGVEQIPGEDDDLLEVAPAQPKADEAEGAEPERQQPGRGGPDRGDSGRGEGGRRERRRKGRGGRGEGRDSRDGREREEREPQEAREPKEEVRAPRPGKKNIILVNAGDREETRVAVVEDGVIVDFQMHVKRHETLVNDIYRGKVVNLEPAIGAAFIDFGQGRNGFLHTSDVLAAYGEKDWSLDKLLTHKIDPEEWDDKSSQPDIGVELSGRGPRQAPKPAEAARASAAARAEEEDGEHDHEHDEQDEHDEHEHGEQHEGDESNGHDEGHDGDESLALPEHLESDSHRSHDEHGHHHDEQHAHDDHDDHEELALVTSDDDFATEVEEAVGFALAAGENGPERGAQSAPQASELVYEAPSAHGHDIAAEAPLATESEAPAQDAPQGRPGHGGRGRGREQGREPGRHGKGGHGGHGGHGGRSRARPRSPISELLQKGQSVVVQVTKDAIGDKGPTLTTYISIPGRYLVLMPSMSRTGVSRKIEDDKERRRLKRILESLEIPAGMGVIVRTAGTGCTKDDLKRDLDYLMLLWDNFGKRLQLGRGPSPLYEESDVAIRTIRDLFNDHTESVIVDDEKVYNRVREFMQKLIPEKVDRVQLHQGPKPLFHTHNVEQDFERIFSRRIDLPSGGSIVFDQAEALVAIDVNSGKTRSDGFDFEDVALRTNLDAVKEIARQIRLRDLGGIIVCDFIDMMRAGSRKKVENALRDAMATDRARSKLGRISQFGLLELTRQRLGPGLSKMLFHNCPRCRGSGRLRTVESRTGAILRRLGSALTLKGFTKVEVRTQPEVVDYMKRNYGQELRELMVRHEREVELVSVSDQIDDSVLRYLRADGREVRPGGRRKR
ncbi:MAG: Rne/Rng family ribonuclease, partial [Planctomycetota bacterium]|nr:Rne/Rng family ribonuclease [Planctomycetota bacterium]